MRLQGKSIVITGAGSGMGRAMAILFAREGARVVAGDWNATTLDETAGLVRGAGGTIEARQGNIAIQADAEALVDVAVETYGRLDALVNNAGVMDQNQGVAQLSDDVWRRVMGINLDGPMYASRRAIPAMLTTGGGSIVNIGSVAGVRGSAAGAAYTASKHALVGLTRNTAWIYAQQGIRCNMIAAGGVKTNIVQSMDVTKLDPIGSARLSVFYPTMPGQLEAEDIATLALFLVSDESRLINGAIIPADAGWTTA